MCCCFIWSCYLFHIPKKEDIYDRSQELLRGSIVFTPVGWLIFSSYYYLMIVNLGLNDLQVMLPLCLSLNAYHKV